MDRQNQDNLLISFIDEYISEVIYISDKNNLIKLGTYSMIVGFISFPFSTPLAVSLGIAGIGSIVAEAITKDDDKTKKDKTKSKFTEDDLEYIEPITDKEIASSVLIDERDIFKFIKADNIKNQQGEVIEFLYEKDGKLCYKVPRGVFKSSILSLENEIAETLMYKDITMTMESDVLMISEKQKELPEMLNYTNKNHKEDGKLVCCIGTKEKLENFNDMVLDFTKNNHILIAGASGWGKSSIIRTILVNLMQNYTVDELKIDLVDFKILELNLFKDYKHVDKFIKRKKDFDDYLDYIETEAFERAEIIEKTNCKDMFSYNKKYPESKIPFKLVVIDEVAQICRDNKLRDKLSNVVALVRAYGIYFVLSTQIPSKKIMDSILPNIGHTIGLHARDSIDADVILKGANLDKISVQGRGKIDTPQNGIETFQSYYLEENEIETLLKFNERES